MENLRFAYYPFVPVDVSWNKFRLASLTEDVGAAFNQELKPTAPLITDWVWLPS